MNDKGNNKKGLDMPPEKDAFNLLVGMVQSTTTKLDALSTKMDREIERNSQRHLELTEKSTAMKGDIRMVSAKVAGIVSAIGLGAGWIFKKFGI